MITGASSGIGKDMAITLSHMGYDLILVARSEKALEEIKKQLNTDVKIIVKDLSNSENVKEVFESTKKYDIDLLINNAGYGIEGKLRDTKSEDIDKEYFLLVVQLSFQVHFYLVIMLVKVMSIV